MKYKELIVGGFAAAAIVLLYFGFNFLKGTDFFKSTATYFVKYDNVSELAVSNPVLVNGYTVGRVSKIGLLPYQGNRVLVELEIEGHVPVGAGAKATLNSGILGQKSILLDLGDVRAPLASGDTISGQLAKGMLDLLSETASPVAYDARTTLKKFNEIIDDLTITLNEINPVVHQFRDTPAKLNAVLDRSGQRIDEVSGSLREVTDRLKMSMDLLDPTLKNLRILTDSLRQLELNKTLNQARSTLEAVSGVMEKLKRGDNTAGRLLTEDSLYNNVNRLLKDLDSLTTHFDRHPKHFLGPLGKSSKKIERDHRKELEQMKKSN